MSTQLQAPRGKTRVVGVDLFDHEDYLVGDYDTQEEAFTKADGHNEKRPGSMDDVYYVYDDLGHFLRKPAGPMGVSP